MIRINRIYAENFRSWRKLEIDNFNSKGLCLIVGNNGSGKSSIRHLIEYALTDTTTDGIPLDELTFNSEGDCKILCELQRGDDSVVIEKYREHHKFKNSTFFYINDVDVSGSSRKETQKIIERELGIDSNLLSVSSIFSQFSKSFSESPDRDRKEIMYKFLDLSKYSKLEEEVKEDIKNIRNDLSGLEAELHGISLSLEDMESSLSSLEEKEKRFIEERDYKIKKFYLEKDSILKELENLEQQSRNTYSNISDMVDDIDSKINKLEAELSHLPESETELMDRLESLRSSSAKYSAELSMIESQLEMFKTNTCPILKTECDALEANYVRLQAENSDRINLLKESIQQNDVEVDKINLILNKISSIKDNIHKFQDEKASLLLEKRDADSRISNSINSLRRRVDAIDNEVDELESKSTPFLGLKRDLENKIETRKKDREKVISNISSIKEILPYLSFWREGFGKEGIPNLKIENALSLIESKMNDYLSIISDSMFVTINSQSVLKSGEFREKISMSVNQKGKSISDFNSFSGGERQRIKIADLMSFSSILHTMDVIILDEVLELSLDKKGIDSVISIMRKRAEEIGSIFVISHNPNVTDKFDNVVRVNKINGESFFEG